MGDICSTKHNLTGIVNKSTSRVDDISRLDTAMTNRFSLSMIDQSSGGFVGVVGCVYQYRKRTNIS